MADKPILFSGPMVRALLAGTKTQTRRSLNPQPVQNSAGLWTWQRAGVSVQGEGLELALAQRIGMGDRLWVRESLLAHSNDQGFRWYGYAADGKDVWPQAAWYKERNNIPSIHMPRWASRLTLAVTDVRVERLQDISEADALAEGIERIPYPEYGEWGWPQRKYHELWNRINGDGAWEANPWVAAYSFTVERGNIDQLAKAA